MFTLPLKADLYSGPENKKYIESDLFLIHRTHAGVSKSKSWAEEKGIYSGMCRQNQKLAELRKKKHNMAGQNRRLDKK